MQQSKILNQNKTRYNAAQMFNHRDVHRPTHPHQSRENERRLGVLWGHLALYIPTKCGVSSFSCYGNTMVIMHGFAWEGKGMVHSIRV